MVNLAVFGAGHWGPNLIRNLHNRFTSTVVSVIDEEATRLDQIRRRFPDISVSTNSEVALQDSAVDAVVVATPTSTHYSLAKRALQAGKHVLVEKPLAANSNDAHDLKATATSRGLILMVGHIFLYNEAVRWVKRCIERRDLGQIYYIAAVRTNLGPIRHDVNAAWDLAAHDVSILNYWLDAKPEWVSARHGSWINTGVADVAFATLGYPNNVIANLHVSWLNPRKARELTVAGTKKMLTFDDMNLNEPIRVYDQQVTDDRSTSHYVDTFASFRASIRNGDITIPRVSSGEPLRQECDHFISCIVNRTDPMTGADEGIAVVHVLEAMDSSAARGGAAVGVMS
jgi:predicted dehydrogenase